MKIKMKLLSDVVFGNGVSIPGGEDIAVLCDADGFPYYKGSTFKGIFREELERYLEWTGKEAQSAEIVNRLLGKSGADDDGEGKLVFSDFRLSDAVREKILCGIGAGKKQEILESLTHLRTFTAVDEEGMTKQGSLRVCRCVNKGIYFYSEIQCNGEDVDLIREVLPLIKEVGTMRSRGFGRVKIEVAE
jgi:CRISPR-associated protein Csx10